MSCLDLCYSVSVKFKTLKDEKKDETAPVVLQELLEDESDSKPEDGKSLSGLIPRP